MSPFAPRDLAVLDAAAEIEIETRAGLDAPIHRTIIWVVIEDSDVYVRSVRGPEGRWYRELIDFPDGALLIADRRIPCRALPAADTASIDACSRGLRRKYLDDGSLRSMLRPEVLATTMRLVPR